MCTGPRAYEPCPHLLQTFQLAWHLLERKNFLFCPSQLHKNFFCCPSCAPILGSDLSESPDAGHTGCLAPAHHRSWFLVCSLGGLHSVLPVGGRRARQVPQAWSGAQVQREVGDGGHQEEADAAGEVRSQPMGPHTLAHPYWEVSQEG